MAESFLTKTSFWSGAGERAAKTAAQTLIASAAVGGGIFSWDFQEMASVSLAATVLSILTSVATGTVTGGEPGITETPTVKYEALYNDAVLEASDKRSIAEQTSAATGINPFENEKGWDGTK